IQSRVMTGAARRTRGLAPRWRVTRSLLRAMLRRDARLFLRDWTVLGDVLISSVLWTLLPLLSAPLIEVDRVLLARAMLLALTVALGNEIAARAVPFERRGLAWARLAPVAPWRWVTARALSTVTIALPIVALATIAVAATLRLSGGALLGTIAIV